MKGVLQIVLSVVASLLLVLAGYLFVPLSVWDKVNDIFYADRLGSTITTILGSDTLSSSRAVINTNFSNLNTDKAEYGSAGAFTALQQFTLASSSKFSCYGPCYFGATATSSFSTAGALTLITPLLAGSGGTGVSTFGGTNHILYSTAADTLASEAAFTYNQTSNLLGFDYASSTNITSSAGAWFAGSSGSVGIATSSSLARLALEMGAEDYSFYVGNQGSTTPTFVIKGDSKIGNTTSGYIGIGTTTPWSRFTIDRAAGSAHMASSSITVTEFKVSTSTNKTIDARDANTQVYQHGASATTLTLSGFVPGTSLKLIVCNPGGTPGAITWATSPAGILLWSGGTAPTLTATKDKCDVLSFIGTVATTSSLKIFGASTLSF